MPFQTVNVLPVLPKPQNGSGARNGPALSSAEDKEMKKKLRNRESALAARERKKQKMLELERRVSELGRENSELKVENCALRGTLSTVMQKYGAPQKEIDDTLKTTQTLTVKKEPTDVKVKPVGRKNTVARISQKVISLGPNERKPRDVTHSVQVKQEAPEITLHTDATHDIDDTPSAIMLPKISTMPRTTQHQTPPPTPKQPSTPKRSPSKVILTSNIMFSPKKSNTIYTHSNNIQPPTYDENKHQMNQHPDDHHVNALDMLELPVVKQEPQDYTSKPDVIPESPLPPANTMIGSPMETPSPSSSESLVTQPVSPLWSASGSPASDSAYSTGSEAGHAPAPSNPIQLSPLRSQSNDALSCTIRVPNIRTIGHKPNYCHKRSYPKDQHKDQSTMWYEPAERLQRLDPSQSSYSAPSVPPPHSHEEHFIEANQTENRVPVIHHENEQQWTNVLHNDIHMTSNLTSTNRTDPQEYLTTPNHGYHTTNQNHHQNHHQHHHHHHHQTNHHQNDTVIDFQNGMSRSNDFDGLTDRSLFQTSMLNIDEVLFGLS